jgi:hypothetical protein
LGANFTATALSRNGKLVVGQDTTNNVAAYWSNGVVTDLDLANNPGAVANSCNIDGSVIVGQYQNLPCLWEKNNSSVYAFVNLPLLSGTTAGMATLISADGTVIAGYCSGLPVVWTFGSVFAIPGTSSATVLNSISDDGSTIVCDLTGGYAANISEPNVGTNQHPGVISVAGLGQDIASTSVNPFFINHNNPENDVVGYEDIFCLTSDGSTQFGGSFDVYYQVYLGSNNRRSEFLYPNPETDGFWTVSNDLTNGSTPLGSLMDFEPHSCSADGAILAGSPMFPDVIQDMYGNPFVNDFSAGNAALVFGGTQQDLNKFLTAKGGATGWTLKSVATQAMSSDGSVILGSGTVANVTQNFITTISPAVSTLTISQSSFVGGTSSQGTVGLDYPAPVATIVKITSGNAAYVASTTATVDQGSMLGAFTLNTAAVPAATNVKVTASLGSTSVVATVTVLPKPTPAITGFYPSAGVIVGGNAATASVTLASAGSAGYVVKLASNSAVVTVPGTVTVPSGKTSVSFSLTSTPVTAVTKVVLTATLGTSTETTIVTVVPPSVSLVRVAPSPVKGGVSTKVAVYLNGKAPAGGFAVTVASSSSAATVPTTITVLAGATAANATVTTSAVTAATTVVVTAKTGSTSVETTMVVSP